MLICPGGGHRLLVFNAEGVEPARYLNSIGVPRSCSSTGSAASKDSPYKPEVHAREDALRAIRLIRSRAAEWGVDPNRRGRDGLLRRRRGRLDAGLRLDRRPEPTPPTRSTASTPAPTS